jgi:hypothetical protein
MRLSFPRKFVLLSGVFVFFPGFAQLSYNRNEVIHYKPDVNNYFSTIAYKIPFRGDNYKFYGTLSYHIFGRAFASRQVHNTLVEAFRMSETDCPDVEFKMLKSSGKRFGRIIPDHKNKNGFYAVFMTPLSVGNTPMQHYFVSGVMRMFVVYDQNGKCNLNERIEIDFESTAEHLLNLDNAAKMYGLRLKKVILSRFLLDDLYKSESGKQLLERDIYFPKYLSRKLNRKYDDLYYVEFDFRE